MNFGIFAMIPTWVNLLHPGAPDHHLKDKENHHWNSLPLMYLLTCLFSKGCEIGNTCSTNHSSQNGPVPWGLQEIICWNLTLSMVFHIYGISPKAHKCNEISIYSRFSCVFLHTSQSSVFVPVWSTLAFLLLSPLWFAPHVVFFLSPLTNLYLILTFPCFCFWVLSCFEC